MAGEGFVFDMISRLKSNNSYLRKSRYFDHKQLYTRAAIKVGVPNLKKATPEELAAIRNRFRKERKRNRIKKIGSACIALVCTVSIALFTMYWVRLALLR